MYKIGIPVTIRQIMATFFHLRMWNNEDETNDKDERIFLAVPSIAGVVFIYKLWFILWKQNTVFELINEIGTHFTDHRDKFVRVNSKLKIFMKCVQYFLLILSMAFIFVTILFPLASERRLVFNIAFPLNRTNSEIAIWFAFAFAAGGTFGSVVGSLFNPILWYLVYSFVLKYEMLGDQFRNMGAQETKRGPTHEILISKRHTLYVKDLIAAIQTCEEINGKLEKFTSIFANLFFMQIATSSLCICGSVYSLAFSSHEDLIQDGIYGILLAYSLFDIFLVMYLANDITLFSGRLLYCLFESNWIEQAQSTKQSILILGERLKRPPEIIVGKIYPLNLVTFNSIVTGAFRMFSILQKLRK